jgi:hypothetical protein
MMRDFFGKRFGTFDFRVMIDLQFFRRLLAAARVGRFHRIVFWLMRFD